MKGLEAGRREVHFPKVFTWTLKFLRILPYPVYQWIIWRATQGPAPRQGGGARRYGSAAVRVRNLRPMTFVTCARRRPEGC